MFVLPAVVIIKDTVLLTIKMNEIMTIILISKQTVHNQDQVASYTLHIFDFSISLIRLQLNVASRAS